MGSSCDVAMYPGTGATGSQKIVVKWWYNPFGKIRYRLKVYTGDRASVNIYVGDDHWEQKAIDAIKQHQDIRVIFRGVQAWPLYQVILGTAERGVPRDRLGSEGESKSDPVTITLSIVSAVIAVSAFTTIGFVLYTAIKERCANIKAKHEFKGPLPLDDQLEFSMSCER